MSVPTDAVPPRPPLGSPSGPADVDALRDWLVAALAAEAGVEAAAVDPSAAFADLGLTSTQAVSLSGQLEDLLGRELPATLLYDHPTPAALAAALAGTATPAGGPTAGTARSPGSPGSAGSPTPAGAPGSARSAESAGCSWDDDPVCIVGMSCRFPGGADTPDAFWRNLAAGVDGAREVPADRWAAAPRLDSDPAASLSAYTTRGGYLDDVAGFDAAFFGISPAEALRMDPQHRLLLEGTWAALEDAGCAPDRVRGSRTGVFVGMLTNQEYGRVQADADGPTCLDDPHYGYGLAPSVAAGRIAYTLDLHGPTLTVDTACSSALLAVHLAAASLGRGECELAVAAGVGALTHPNTLLQACRSRMLAPDGRTKAFDADADGYLIGEGCGVVVLERRSVARARGHRVLAVLRGSAVNSDGQSNGMTAPSLPAQAAVVRAALDAAGLAPAEVDVVEAHGSGTRLGDAIELAALREVFGADRDARHPLVIGAVKTGVGHLLGAAGVAGLIKVVLAMRAGVVPPNLHLQRPLPAAEGGTVRLPVAAEPWPARGGRRVAGVSSFGWSGTNVHVVVEHAATSDAATGPRPAQLLPLSARTPNALAAAATRLADAVDAGAAGDPVDLAALARTLQDGRAALDHRLAVVCADGAAKAEVSAAVRAAAADAARTRPTPAGGPPPVVFLLPGTGDQYPGMAAGLYRDEPVFAAAFDTCAAAAAGIGIDLHAALTAGPADTVATHAVVFAVDYATARLWQSLGAVPAAVLGYSLGEYAAACIAGVFAVADAVRLVVGRARLVAAQPPGAMLAVGLPAAELTGELTAELHVAACNGPAMTVVAGAPEPVARLARELQTRGVAHLPVNATRPMHTPLLDPLRPELTRLAAATTRRAPTIPLVSGRTGTLLTAEEARDPAYWAGQTCEPVRFDLAIAAAAPRPHTVLVEAGPGQTLTSLALAALGAAGRTDAVAVPTIRPQHAAGAGSDRQHLLQAVGRYWAAGGVLDWAAARAGAAAPAADPAGPAEMLALPTYPFEHQRYWPTPAAAPPAAAPPEAGGNEPDVGRWSYAPVWQPAPAARPAAATAAGERWLVCAPPTALTAAVVDGLRAAGATVRTLLPAAGQTGKPAEGVHPVDPASTADYDAVLADLDAQGAFPTAVLHAWSLTPPPGGDAPERVRAGEQASFGTLAALVRALGRRVGNRTLHVAVATSGARSVGAGAVGDPTGATALGVCRTVPAEYPRLRCRSIDLDPDGSDPALRAAELVRELRADPDLDAPAEVALRGGRRWVPDWQRVPVPPVDPSTVWRPDGCYLITGGFGGLGLGLARQLAARGPVRLALLGRGGGDGSAAAAAVAELESLGASVLALAADVADPAAVREAVAAVLARFGALHGVVHAAGVPASGLLDLADAAAVERVLRPKVTGTVVLREALRDVPLDFFLAYSSAVVALGGLGESDYAAANSFLGAYAYQARHEGCPMVAVHWGPWRWDAWSAGAATPEGLPPSPVQQLRARFGITDAEGFEVLTRLARAGLPEVLVVQQDLGTLAARWAELTPSVAPVAPDRSYPRPQLRTAYRPPRGELEQQVCALWQRYLGLDRVGVDDQFFELGGTSLVGLSVAAELEKRFGVAFSAADLFAAPTVGELVRLLAARTGRPEDTAPTPTPPPTPTGGGRGADRRHRAAAAARRTRPHPQDRSQRNRGAA